MQVHSADFLCSHIETGQLLHHPWPMTVNGSTSFDFNWLWIVKKKKRCFLGTAVGEVVSTKQMSCLFLIRPTFSHGAWAGKLTSQMISWSLQTFAVPSLQAEECSDAAFHRSNATPVTFPLLLCSIILAYYFCTYYCFLRFLPMRSDWHEKGLSPTAPACI